MRRVVTREDLTRRFASLQESIPGVKAARRASTATIAIGAILLLAAVVLLGRRRRDGRP